MGHYTDAPEDNLLGITDQQMLNEQEAKRVFRAEQMMLGLPETVELTPGLLLDIYRTAFGHLYDWAGQYRRSNPNVGSYLPPAYQQVPTLLYQFVEEIRYRLTQVQTRTDVVALLAYAHHRFVAIHPFTNGNGRMARLLTNLLAWQHGYRDVQLYQREAGKGRELYLRAIKQGNDLDYRALEQLIDAQLTLFGTAK